MPSLIDRSYFVGDLPLERRRLTMVGSATSMVAILALMTSIDFVNGLAMSAVLDAEGKFHVSWEFDETDITFEVVVETTGYVGLGFSPNGDMPGSDIVIGWVDDTTGKGHLSDRHATSQSTPKADEMQDYTLLASSQNATHTHLSFKRPLKLCHFNDRHIKDETARLIWAYNDADPSADGTPSYHNSNRGSKSVYLLNPPTSVPPMPDDVIYEEFRNPSIPIPVKDTTYWCQSFPVPRLNSKHHVIKVEPVITPGLEAEVHHILVYACYHEVNSSTHGQGHECNHPNMPGDFDGCTAVTFAWAIGGGASVVGGKVVEMFCDRDVTRAIMDTYAYEGETCHVLVSPLYLPEEAGFPFGYEGDPTMVLMETHFDNPQLKPGLVDASGLRMTLTPTLREHDAGIIQMGVNVSRSQVIPPGAKSFRTNGHCYPECLEQAMANSQDKLTVVAYNLHTHLAGHAIRIRHFRKGKELPRIGEDNNYDFNFQETRFLANQTSVFPGDYFVVECDYKTDQRTTVTYGGLSTREEMCLGFILYYPRIRLNLCVSSVTEPLLAGALGATVERNGTITSPPKWQGKSIHDVIDNEINWDSKSTRDSFEEAINREGVDGVYPICTSGKTYYPVMSGTKPRPLTIWKLPEETPECVSGAPGGHALRAILCAAILSATAGYFFS